MEAETREDLRRFLEILPAVEFCGVYGSALHPNNHDKSKMVDYILGVSDPMRWHSENLKLNSDHYASWIVLLDGSKLITEVADRVGVGVHFNPFVSWNDRKLKYGVVRVQDLIEDVLNWKRFYLSGRLQKPVHILVDNMGLQNMNSTNLKAAVSAALLLLPSQFSEVDLYTKICSLSYMGDVRMYFAEDQYKVKKIVMGQFESFQCMYKPFLEEYEAKNLLRVLSNENHPAGISQDCSLSATLGLISSLPPPIKAEMGMKLGEKKLIRGTGQLLNDFLISSREEAAKCMQKLLRRRVMISSGRQAVSGLLAVGCLNATRYLGQKIRKAWISWT